MQTASGVTQVRVPHFMGLLQNLPSIVCGHVLDPQPGDNVIDLCAAPGHKTTHIAALMENQVNTELISKYHCYLFKLPHLNV